MMMMLMICYMHLVFHRHITPDIFNIYFIHMFVICFYISHLSVV